MQRRQFIKTSFAIASAAGASQIAGSALADAQGMEWRVFYELRGYTLKPGKQQIADDYLSKAFIPALGRLGVGPVGVFYDVPTSLPAKPAASLPAPPQPSLWVLICHMSLDSFRVVTMKLAADAEYQKAGEAYLRAPAADPVYDRIESSLLLAFTGMPKLDAPDSKKARIFQLRTYESCSEAAGRKKIEMFNQAGEIAIFRRVGLKPVFFGETIAGLRMPNLTYMLTFENEEAQKEAWGKFRTDPEWLKLRAMPEYADKAIVSKIWNRVLKPAEYSEV